MIVPIVITAALVFAILIGAFFYFSKHSGDRG